MALKVWLPLDGDLRNLGCSNAVATNDGATIDNSGKIGKCYAFSNTRIIIDSTDVQNILSTTTQPFSMACWIYLNSDETDRVIIFGNYNADPFVNWELTAGCVQRLCAGSTSNFTEKSGGTAVPKTTWTHITATYDGNNTTFYQNGVQIYTTTGANTLTAKTASARFYLGSDTRNDATRLKGKINDFRFYDHCLSAAEVHEISQGLVLHYKLDDITNGVKDSSGYGHNGNYVNTTNSSDTTRYNASIACIGTTVDNSSNTIDGAQFFYCNMEMPAMNTITVTWWGKNITYGRGGIFETSNTIQTNTNKGTDYNTTAFANWDSTFGIYNGSTRINIFSNFKLDGVWHYHTITFDSANVKYYLDGVIKQTSALTGSLPAWNSFCIGLGRAGGVWRQIEQNVSDFRIYCTALAADDVLQLYHTSAKVDNKQNLHTFELVENNSKIQINKRGQTLCNELEENAATKFYKTDQIIETNEIIEL